MAKQRKGPTPRRPPSAPVAPSRWTRLAPLLLGAVIAGAFVLGVAALVLRDNSDSNSPSLRELVENAPDPGPIHVHGLGINPKDGSLYIATHTGLWRTASDETRAERVGDRLQDTMGFTIVGRDRFLGSGHPDQEQYRDEGLPPNLGLIESTDGGESWEPISLLGEADFHVLRSRGSRVIGFDSTNERLMISRDAGRSWTERTPPARLVDLAVNPSRRSHFIASGENALWESTNQGRSWTRAGRTSGLLAWPILERLYLVTGGGEVLVSSTAGKRWATVGDVGGEPAALLAQSASELYVALHDGTIKRSPDAGRTWSIRSQP